MTPGRAVGLAGLAAFLVCLPAVRGGFVLDDNYLVADNSTLRSLANIPSFFVKPWGGGAGGTGHAGVNAAYYRPLTSSLQAIEYALFGDAPLGWHVTSVLLHVVATALGTLLAVRVLRNLEGGLVAGLVFAVHPAHTETMAAITYQTTLLAGLLAMLALRAFERVLDDDGAGLRTSSVVALAAFLASAAKEEAAVLPLLALAWLLIERPAHWRRVLVFGCGSLLAGTVAVLAIRTTVATGSSVTFFADAGRDVVVPTMVRVMALYAELLVLPIRLCFFYDWFVIPPEASLSADVVRGALLIVGLVAAVVVAARRAPGMAIGLLWIPLGLIPVMHFVPILNVAGERFLYLPSLGFSVAVGGLFVVAVKRARKTALVGAAVIITLFAARTLLRWPDWHDDRILNQTTAADFPQTPNPLINLARMDLADGDRAGALRHLQEARRRVPDWPVVHRMIEEVREPAGVDPRRSSPVNPAVPERR